MALGRDTVRIFITGDTTGFKKAVGEVESTGKRLSGLAKTAIAGGIAAGGAAALKAIGNYSKLADTVRDFSTVTGLSAVQSSKAIEAFGDLGVESSQLQSSIAKFNKALGTKGADAFKKYGVQAERAADGTVDVNKTFVNAIKAIAKIEDPTLRAAAAADMFGKSWQDLAPLIPFADELAQRVDAVGKGQIITDEQLAKQQKFKESMDALKDRGAILANTFASAAIPAITTFAALLEQVPTPILAASIAVLAGAVAVGKLAGAFTAASKALTLFATNPQWIALAALVGILIALWTNAEKVQKALGGIFYGPAKAVNNFLGGSLGKGTTKLGPASEAYLAGKRAMGGPVMAGAPYLVGERGPELFVPRASGNIVPNGAGGMVVNQYITVESSTPYELNRALERSAASASRAAGR